jgi:hypothetical protein
VAFALGLRLITVGLNAVAGRSVAAPPVGLLAGGLVFDLARRWRPGRAPHPLHLLGAVGAAWVATFAVQAPWLRAVGKTWWTNDVLFPAFVWGGLGAFGGALAGKAVGERLGGLMAKGEPAVDRAQAAPFRGRGIGVPATGIALGLAIALTAVPMFRTVSPFKLGTYAFQGRILRVSVPGSSRTDWISTIGPLRRTGLFTPARHVPAFSKGTSNAGGPIQIQGTLRPFLGRVLGKLNVSWLAGLARKGTAFEGTPRGDGEWLLVWYLHGDDVWAGVVPRGNSGGIILIHQLFSPPSRSGAALRALGPLIVALLVALAVIVAMWILEFAARSRTGPRPAEDADFA